MKTPISSLLIAVTSISLGYAGTPIEITEVPKPATDSIKEYFPGSQVLSAQRDTEDGKEEFEVKIQYKDIRIEVELSSEGVIHDLDVSE